MTPQEKAVELRDKFKSVKESRWVHNAHGGEIDYEELTDECAKQCALIAVEYLIAEERLWMDNTYSTANSEWEKVKHEIEKL